MEATNIENGAVMTSKIRIKLAENEIEVEGSEDFVLKARDDFEKKYFPDGVSASTKPLNLSTNDSSGAMGFAIDSYGSKFGLTAQSNARELVKLAGCWLMIEERKTSFSEDECRTVMKQSNVFKKTKHGNHFKVILRALTSDGVFIKKTEKQYAVDPEVLSEVRSQLEQQS